MKNILKLLFLIIISINFTNCREEYGELLLINSSANDIENISVELSSESNEISVLKVGEEKRIIFEEFSDAHYIISGNYVDGDEFKYEFGYVTNGMKFSDSLYFLDSSKYDYRFNFLK